MFPLLVGPPPRVLLLHRVPAKGGGWQPVTGRVEDADADLEAAARRELAEETGLRGDFDVPSPLEVPGAPPGLIGYEEHAAGSKGLHLNFVFVARVASRVVVPDGSFTEHAWFRDAPAESPLNVREGVRVARRVVRDAS